MLELLSGHIPLFLVLLLFQVAALVHQPCLVVLLVPRAVGRLRRTAGGPRNAFLHTNPIDALVSWNQSTTFLTRYVRSSCVRECGLCRCPCCLSIRVIEADVSGCVRALGIFALAPMIAGSLGDAIVRLVSPSAPTRAEIRYRRTQSPTGYAAFRFLCRKPTSSPCINVPEHFPLFQKGQLRRGTSKRA